MQCSSEELVNFLLVQCSSEELVNFFPKAESKKMTVLHSLRNYVLITNVELFYR